MTPPAPATKRACDACHRRKVRCNGSNPCQNCEQASLACTYNKPPQKKGPKGHRAKVISELRESQEIKTEGSAFRDGYGIDSPLTSPIFFRQNDLLSQELVEVCIAHFFSEMYTTLPIMPRSWIEERAREMRNSPESYCLVGSLCAYMVIQPGIRLPLLSGPLSPEGATPRQQAISHGIRILETIKRAWVTIDHPDNVTTATILTCFFLSAANFGVEKHQRAWYWLQEAMVFGRMLRIHDEKTYRQGNPNDQMNRRLFWLLFISERAQALHKHRDLTFHETIEFPKAEPDLVEELGITGMTCLYNLFRIVDGNVSEIWNKLRTDDEGIFWPRDTTLWLAQLQQQLITAIPPDYKFTQIQQADIEITRAWLRCIVWQLSTASHVLSSASPDQSMTLTYPIQIVSDLVAVTTSLPLHSMEAHGMGLIEKLFDIACTLIDTLAIVTLETAPFEYEPRYYLSHLLQLINALGGGETRFGPLLEAKFRDTPRASTVLALATGSLSSSSNPSLNGISSRLEGGSSGSPSSTATVGSPTVLAGIPQLTTSPTRYPPMRQHASSAPETSAMNIAIALSSHSPPGRDPSTDPNDPYPLHFATDAGFPK